MHEISSLSFLVGTAQCNAYCDHCAALDIRKYAPKQDGYIDKDLMRKAIDKCYSLGARQLSISGCGEPTLSPLAVTNTLDLVSKCKNAKFSPINLYSNGIIIGENEKFSNTYLPLWKKLGLTTVYIAIYDIKEENNAEIFKIRQYPSLDLIISRIHDANLLVRANLVLSKKNIPTLEKFISTIEKLKEKGIDMISTWPIRDRKDDIDFTVSPSVEELNKMKNWAEQNQDPNYVLRFLLETSQKMYKKKKKLTLFPDGSLSDTWCN